MKYIKDIENYQPYNEQEQMDKTLILNFIKNNSDHLYRENLAAHLTSSAIVINQDKTKVLFAYHNIYDSWSWVGGHNDGDDDLLKVAIKETKEETGIEEVNPYSEDIYMIDVIYVQNHIKNGKHVPDHLHLNVTYLLIANDNQTLTVKEDENQAVAWFELDDVFNKISEPRMIPIYKKAFDKLKSI
ncbi:MAG: NUDIX hydrolase [Tenericutes bacterium]|jgi:ADP-ribose pyrophosphatase YjhB (NUDIX family)|nr:NUDIX hydrolase [Mycoplasmatota bacterium]